MNKKNTKNTKLNEGYSQVVVWQGVELKKEETSDFLDFIKKEFEIQAQFLEVVTTLPGRGGPGGRKDVLFAIKDCDIMRFAVPRLNFDMRWLEDCLDNGDWEIYPDRISKYRASRTE